MSKPTVSHETALKLAEAGFAPPEAHDGQFWFDVDNDLYVVKYTKYKSHVNMAFIGRDYRDLCKEKSDFDLFAPTATDILSQFPGMLKMRDGQWQCSFTVTQFFDDCYYDDCPHEAAAKAFLAWKAGLV